ncbi:MAG: radical SAM protein, partial [Deltaproteobacteria bacterium]|nr:radical SAM protein [Deltaproteobacteria bacterium]
MAIMINPAAIRIEACSICQLRCPLCPRTRGETADVIGRGVLKFDDFRRFIDRNPQIRSVELGNFGEVFLNKELPKILEYAHLRQVTTEIDEGANLNDATDEALEALVKYRTARVRCAVDGVTRESYSKYRVGGDLGKVIANIQKINFLKDRYASALPRLIFQFVVFSHNEHEMDRAGLLAKMLRMDLDFKLNFFPGGLPVQNRDRIRQYLGYADRAEFMQQKRRHYCRRQCSEMWQRPQINWDGKLLGCCRNIWGSYADNMFEADLVSCVNN